MTAGAQPKRNGFVALGRALFSRGGPGLGRRLGALPRMFGARFRGRYQGMSWGRFAALIVAAVYVLSPIDLVPEAFLLVFGLADDGVALAWLAGALLDEAERFLSWEESQARTFGRGPHPGPRSAPGHGAPGPQYAPGPQHDGAHVPGPEFSRAPGFSAETP
jgi:uncharacterized membrane protein YkvA (DUF1232 family)